MAQHDETQNEQVTEPEVLDAPNQPDDTDIDSTAELTADLQRVQAEFMNYRRRSEAERADAINFAKSRVIRELLSVRDSFDQELAHRPEGIDAKWAASIDSIRAQFDRAMKNQGVERFISVGQAFDPHRHEAVVMDDGEGSIEVVTDELQAGYILGETVLRHAMVKVGRTDTISEPKTEEALEDAEQS